MNGPRLRRLSFIALLVLACGQPPRSHGVTVRDDLNRTVALPARIERAVTLAPNLTEMVFAVGAESRLVGTDDFSDEPPAAKRLPRVGGMQPNIERIAALKPDVVIATTNGNHPALAPALRNVGIPLFVLRTDRVDQIPVAMSRLAELLGGSKAPAERVRAQLEGQRRSRARSPRVLFAVWADPLYVAGKDTFSDDLLLLTGATNAIALKGWPQYSLEMLTANPPDLFLYPAKSVTRQQVDALLAKAPGVSERVSIVPVDENLFTRPGPRVTAAAGELNRILDSWEQRP